MGNIVTKEERDLAKAFREMAGEKAAEMTDDEILETLEVGRQQVLGCAAMMIAAYASETQNEEFNVFVDNSAYGRMVTKIRLNHEKMCVDTFVVESVDGIKARYWCDLDQLSGPELTGLTERVALLLDTIEDEKAA